MASWMFPFHVTVVTVFLIFLTFKTVLLLLNKHTLLHRIRTRTKLIEIILGILILISGIVLVIFLGYFQPYLVTKIILILIAIPLGIVGLKRENKILATLSVLLFIYIYGVSETKSISINKDEIAFDEYGFDEYGFESNGMEEPDEILNSAQSASLQQGKVIYKVLCAECHGEETEKKEIASLNLANSQLSIDEQIVVIAKGKGAMKGYDAELSEQEIELVAAYTKTLQE